MSNLLKCNQQDCTLLPSFRFTWPGRDEAAICFPHKLYAEGIAAAMGFHLQFIALTPEQMFEAERALGADATKGTP